MFLCTQRDLSLSVCVRQWKQCKHGFNACLPANHNPVFRQTMVEELLMHVKCAASHVTVRSVIWALWSVVMNRWCDLTHSLWGSAGETAGCRPCSCWSDAGRRLCSSCRAPSRRCCGRETGPPREARTPSRPIPATDARDPLTTGSDLQTALALHSHLLSYGLVLSKLAH